MACMIHILDDTALVLSADPLPFEAQNAAHIDVFWEQAFAANPHLWNGVFYMFSDVRIENNVLCGNAHRTDFATFLYWRDHRRDKAVTHITGTTLPVTADNILLAIKMSKHTANAGRIYFPSGSFDNDDLVRGEFDVVRNFSREMAEEIGLEVRPEWLHGPFVASQMDDIWEVTRVMKLPMDFDAIEKHWQRHRAAGGDDEIECLVPIASSLHAPKEMPLFAQELSRYYFENYKPA